MVDTYANSVEDLLIEGLSFKLKPGASYVTDRRSVSFFNAGGNIFSSGSGARVARINLTGDGWLDPSTVRLTYTLTNTDGNAAHILRPISGGWSFFRRARCLVGGAIVDDVDYYNRVHEKLHILTSKANRDNDNIEGFGTRWDDDSLYGHWTTDNYHGGVIGGSSRFGSFKPLFGIVNQPKLIPLMWCPLTFEFEIVSNPTDPIIGPSNQTGGTDFSVNNTSNQWQISDMRVLCDVVTLDSALQNSYAQHVLSGNPLPINYSTFITQYQTVAGGDISVNVTRAISRLKSVFLSFDAAHAITSNAHVAHTTVNTFVHPMNGVDYALGDYNYNEEMQYQISIGSKLFPEYPCRSLAEAFYQLKKALGIHGSAYHSIALTTQQYLNDHFIIGIDTEKVLDAGWTGLNTRAGDLMVVRVKGTNQTLGAFATILYIVLHADQVLEIRDTGVQIFD